MKAIEVTLRQPLADKAGQGRMRIDCEHGSCSIAALVDRIQAATGVTSSLFVAVNGQLGAAGALVKEGDDVVVFLPIAGG